MRLPSFVAAALVASVSAACAPSLAAQMLSAGGMVLGSPTQSSPQSGPSQPAGCAPAMAIEDPATTGVQREGKELKQSVKQVAALPWHDSLAEARVMAGASGKPILWVQSLGDLEGFA